MTILKPMLLGGIVAALMLGSVAFAQMTEPQNKPAEPTNDSTEPDETADEPVATQEASSSDEMAKANEELDRVQATKTTKDQWDKCEEESHYAKSLYGGPTQAEQEAYKVQMACMGPEAE